ncbi:hypothetical protein NQ176_g8601 [Zarea fungicola]|uniref:Uncharacterized protein n=1 Tax=Zarea fungicola TaxID=93591 RepID=A0ACC1MT86_9HYPO|nr:hypothetical protein NQ176_g8601 [Lecanicillium fungicola]
MDFFRFTIEVQQNKKIVPEDVLEPECFHGKAASPRGVVGANGKTASGSFRAGMIGDRSDLNPTLNAVRESTAATVSDESAIRGVSRMACGGEILLTLPASPPGDLLYPLLDIIAIERVPTGFQRVNAEKIGSLSPALRYCSAVHLSTRPYGA